MLIDLWRRLQRSVLRMISSGSLDDPGLFSTVKNAAQPLVYKNFGWYGGTTVYVNPIDGIDMARLINNLDALADGRKSERGLQFFVGGRFLSSTTRHKAQQDDTSVLIKQDHDLLAASLSNTGAFIRYVEQRLKKFAGSEPQLPQSLTSFASILLRDIVCQGLFGLEAVPSYLRASLDEFAALIADKLSSFNHLMEVKIESLYYADLYPYDAELLAAREKFIAARQRFIDEQKNAVTAELQSYALAPKKDKSRLTVLARFVLDRIEKFTAMQSPADKINRIRENVLTITVERTEAILQDDFLCTLPVLPLPGDMIVIPVCSALSALAYQPALLEALRRELSECKYADKTPDEKRVFIKTSKEQSGLLHRIFLESLRREFLQKSVAQLEMETVLTRYASEDIDVFDTSGQIIGRIAPGSLVAILNALPRFNPERFPEPEQFDPERFHPNQDPTRSREKLVLNTFSYGDRRCPAKEAAEYIFASLVAEIVQHYDIVLSGGASLAQTEISLCIREAGLSTGNYLEPAL